MILGVPSSPGGQGVGGVGGGKVGSVEKGLWCVCMCVFLGLREKCGEVAGRAGRAESRIFLAVELGRGNS